MEVWAQVRDVTNTAISWRCWVNPPPCRAQSKQLCVPWPQCGSLQTPLGQAAPQGDGCQTPTCKEPICASLRGVKQSSPAGMGVFIFQNNLHCLTLSYSDEVIVWLLQQHGCCHRNKLQCLNHKTKEPAERKLCSEELLSQL